MFSAVLTIINSVTDMPEKKKYDACMLFLGDIENDARTLNISRTFAKNGKKVCIISYCSPEFAEQLLEENIRVYAVEKSEHPKARKRWRDFSKKAMEYILYAPADNYFAMDLYSMSPAKKLASKYKSRLYYDAREIYSALGPLYKNPFKQKLLTAIEQYFTVFADEFIVSGLLDAKYLKRKFSTAKKFNIIMNLPPEKEYIESDILRKKFGIPAGSKILIYQGMILPGRGIIPVINALKDLPDHYFCILGDGSFKKECESAAKESGTNDRVIFAGKVPYDELHEYTCSADAGICFIEPVSFSYELALPNKLFEYAAAHLPVLATDLPAIRDIYQKHEIGMLVKPESAPAQIAAEIKVLFEPEKRQTYIENARKLSEIYNYEAQEQKIIEMLDKNG